MNKDTHVPASESPEQTRDRDDAVASRGGPPLRDPRSQAALDNVGLDDQANLLDPELDDQIGDDGPGPSFMDDVRSDVGRGNNGEPR
ncbi:hypothetical protein E4582_09545 [Luteimonas yindakuii]|uniref:Uncharacterized protein n=1 Tax=Luteimonas yindakuii TaxID=2565782 RepID=A0A4Z1RLK9_9GAMM|nr:hypothetical protein [Luteimonas yindakuii]TKS54979.1 hypothetical protein E4582_09545 [Luteimonas yindakuii]